MGEFRAGISAPPRDSLTKALDFLMDVITTASEAEDDRVVTSDCLETICTHGKWQVGQAWFLGEAGTTLFCSHAHYSELEIPDFRRDSLGLHLHAGIDLPGLALQSKSPLWWSNCAKEKSFLRSKAAQKAGLQSAFAFPILKNGQPQAVFEFFSKEQRKEEEQLLAVAAHLGPHLGMVFERKREGQNLRYQAYHDLLTGLPNRTLMEDRFRQALAHARRNRLMMALLFLDLDHFKGINDRLGHQVGDQLLREVAKRLTMSLREVDTIARLGGDEFTILMPEITEIQDAAKAAQKILSAFEAPFVAEGQTLQSSTSIGISLYPHDGQDLSTLMKNADIALYRAKEKGRNNYQLYTQSMTVTALARLKMENDLRFALERDQFLLYYQPQLNIQTGKIVGIEALLRWQHPQMGIFLPAEFFPMAEEGGYLAIVWEWALRTACRQLRRWRDTGLVVPLLTMNIAPNQLRNPRNLKQTVLDALHRAQLEYHSLELEITQTARLTMDQALPVIRDLKGLGIRIALDDFGSGTTSFMDVKRFPMDTIKIDPCFIHGTATDSADRAILASIISLAHGLNLRVIAEGVETTEQLSYLRSQDCDCIQGFFFCRPLPPESLSEFLMQALPG